jgi:hypothetical protein
MFLCGILWGIAWNQIVEELMAWGEIKAREQSFIFI